MNSSRLLESPQIFFKTAHSFFLKTSKYQKIHIYQINYNILFQREDRRAFRPADLFAVTVATRITLPFFNHSQVPVLTILIGNTKKLYSPKDLVVCKNGLNFCNAFKSIIDIFLPGLFNYLLVMRTSNHREVFRDTRGLRE